MKQREPVGSDRAEMLVNIAKQSKGKLIVCIDENGVFLTENPNHNG